MPAGRRARRRRPWALWAAAPRPPAAPGWPRQRPSLGQPCRLGWWSTFSYSSRRSILPPVALLVFLAAAAPAGIVAPQLGSGGHRRRRTPTVGARRSRRRPRGIRQGGRGRGRPAHVQPVGGGAA